MLAKSVSLFATDVTSKWRRTGKCTASRSVSELLLVGTSCKYVGVAAGECYGRTPLIRIPAPRYRCVCAFMPPKEGHL